MPDKGIFKRIFHRDAKPVNAQRVILSDTQKRAKDDPDNKKNAGFEAIDFSDLYEEPGLEETPSADFKLEAAMRREKNETTSRSKERVHSEILPSAASGYRSERRANNKKSSFSSLGSVFSAFKKESQTSNSSALEFAEIKKRVSRKGKKHKRILVYSGTGLLVIAIMLVVVLVPGGAAAPAGGSKAPGKSQTATQGTAYIAIQSMAVSPTLTDEEVGAVGSVSSPTEPIKTPKATQTPEPTVIETTAPDVTPPPINIDEEVESFKVEADRYYNEMGYSTNHYEYTDEEFYMLAQVIHAEARGESTKGRIAVGNVVMNRVLCRGFPGNTIKAVLTRANQFAYNPNTKPGVASKIAARQVLDYEVWVIPQNIYYFKVSSSKSNWGSHKYKFNIGSHAFYSHSYSGRYRGDAIPPSMYERTFKWPTRGCKPEARVYRLQWMLNKLGYDVKADKYFGESTREAIKEFQKKKGMKVDGVAGPATLKALIKQFGLREYYVKFCM